MPIYVQDDFPRAPDGRQWKHEEGCPVLVGLEAMGYESRRIRNSDARKESGHLRRRCPVCMPDSDYPDTAAHNPGVEVRPQTRWYSVAAMSA